jgi:anti-sigma regulatory factor (Ser/Thr protein kinase)
MISHGTQLRHSAFVYDSEDEYVARSVRFLREGLEAGEGAIVANLRPGLAAMREALGSDADQVRFVDVSSTYTRPAQTLAAYHQVYAEQLQEAPSLRAVGDVQFGLDPEEWDLWTGYEAVLNRSFGHLPVWVLCSYDANKAPDPILEGVRQTHPEVLTDKGWNMSDDYEDPDRLLHRLTPEPTPLPDLRSIPFGRNLEEFREQLAPELITEEVAESKILDMLLAASEVAKNAREHGGGIEEVHVGRAEGRFVCEVVDRGIGFDDPAAGYLAPREGVGRGLWIARQLTWLIEFFRSPQGFTVRIWL